jgi:hypothetical protein
MEDNPGRRLSAPRPRTYCVEKAIERNPDAELVIKDD